jgi:MFS family permease
MNLLNTRLYEWIKSSSISISIWAGTAAFLTYFSMYMYRKPFSANTYEGLDFFGIDYKIILVISQVIGYAISKFYGIKFIAELKNTNKERSLLLLIGASFLSLVLFAITPHPFGFIWLFFNGLPLGLIWGIVFSYLEGRKITEVLTVIISANFIFSSGVAKSIGVEILKHGYSWQSMPAIAGIITLPVLLFSIWMLTHIPPPSSEDIALRIERKPMDKQSRKLFLKQHGYIMALIVLVYIVFTIIRDVRDNFAVELWNELGLKNQSSIYVLAEIPIAVIVFITLGLLFLIKSNSKALFLNLFISINALAIIVLSTLIFSITKSNPILWMTISGLCLFLPYIIFNGIIFDRFIGAFKVNGNVGFIIYMCDAFGYLASVLILLAKNFSNQQISWLNFYFSICIIGGSIGVGLLILCTFNIHKKLKTIQ